jgi:inner membrane protein involved in colicin E2 resistance
VLDSVSDFSEAHQPCAIGFHFSRRWSSAFSTCSNHLSLNISLSRSYAIACTSIIGMTAVYSRVRFPNERRTGVVATCVIALYRYLFVLLTNEDYALLIGSIGLFVVLASIMYVTRRLDWYVFADCQIDARSASD